MYLKVAKIMSSMAVLYEDLYHMRQKFHVA